MAWHSNSNIQRRSQETSFQGNLLDDCHRMLLHTAVQNILRLDIAECVFAQILDGFPTLDAARYLPRDHPVAQLQHNQDCDGFLTRARELRDDFDVSTLVFEPWLLQSFQESAPETSQFARWLVELVAIACHQMAAYLYEKDDGAHKHQVHQDWYAQAMRDKQAGLRPYTGRLHRVAFSHVAYWNPDLCPRGDADIAGYWAESQIFGGVVLLDRGESERECKSIWLHGARTPPHTLYPPTPAQFDALAAYLVSDPSNNRALRDACPLPIHATADNRPRWDPWEARAKFHIFRDADALDMPAVRYLGCTSLRAVDWPELDDQRRVYQLETKKSRGETYDADELEAARRRTRWITPTSPESHPKPDWLANSVWRGR